MFKLCVQDIWNLEDMLNLYNPNVRIYIIEMHDTLDNYEPSDFVNINTGPITYTYRAVDPVINITFSVRYPNKSSSDMYTDYITLNVYRVLSSMIGGYDTELFAMAIFEMLDEDVRKRRKITLYK